jgi:hypothetical protein
MAQAWTLDGHLHPPHACSALLYDVVSRVGRQVETLACAWRPTCRLSRLCGRDQEEVHAIAHRLIRGSGEEGRAVCSRGSGSPCLPLRQHNAWP